MTDSLLQWFWFMAAGVLPDFLFGFYWVDFKSRFRNEAGWFVLFVFLFFFWSMLVGYLSFSPVGIVMIAPVLFLSVFSCGVAIATGIVAYQLYLLLRQEIFPAFRIWFHYWREDS